jgi:hypothetical protein
MSFSKDNLIILKNLNPDELLGLENTKLFIDDRYLVFYRTKYSVREIVKLLEDSFHEYIKLYQDEIDEDTKTELKLLINEAIKGYDIFSETYNYREDRRELITNTKETISLMLEDAENKEIDTPIINEDNNNDDLERNTEPNNESPENTSTVNYIIFQIINGWYSFTNYINETFTYFFY